MWGAALGGAGGAAGGASALGAGAGGASAAGLGAGAASAAPAAAGVASAAAPAAAGAGASTGGLMGSLTTGLNIVQGLQNLAGPQGSLVKGDLGGAMKDYQGLSANLSKAGDMFGPSPSSAPKDRNLSEFGMSVEGLNKLPPEARQEVLRILVGRK